MKAHSFSFKPCISYLFILLFGSSWLGFTDVKVEVVNDVYVLPVAELVSTKTNPEIINIENDLIAIQSIPNRGRVVSSFTLKSSGQRFFYTNLKPDPMILPGGLHSVEFGGYYLALPWNSRDRQPFDLSFKITSSNNDFAELYLWGKDMFKRTLTECWVRVRKGSPVVEIEVEISSTSSKRAAGIDFRDYAILSVGPEVREKSRLLIPSEGVEVLESRESWLGDVGSTLTWASRLSYWKEMKHYFQIRTADRLKQPCVGVMYPSLAVAFVKFWEPDSFFDSVEIWSWGRDYRSEKGAGPYFASTSIKKIVRLEPKADISFQMFFTAVNLKPRAEYDLNALCRKAQDLAQPSE